MVKHRRFFRYSLRTLLLVILVLSVWLGWMANEAAKQRQAVELVKELGGSVVYERDPFDTEFQPMFGGPPSEGLFHSILGHDWFYNVNQVILGKAELTCEQLGDLVDGLPHVVALDLRRTPVTDAGLRHLASLKQLERLDLSGTDITDAGLAHLSGLQNLVSLSLDRTKVTDAGLQHLRGLENLRVLSLKATDVSSDGVATLLKKLPNFDVSWD